MTATTTKRCVLLLLLLGSAAGAELNFQQVILDRSYIAYERDVGDIDGDGDNDVVAVQEGDTNLQVFRAPDWTRSALVAFSGTYRYPRADDLKLTDLDGDGDLDVVTRLGAGPADDGAGIAVWCENLGRGTNFTQHLIGNSFEYVKDIVIADFDRDGRPDVAMRMDSRTQLWLQDARWRWSEVRLTHPPHEGMDAGDLDGDGDPDLILNGYWFETPDTPAAARIAANYTHHVIDAAWFNQSGDWTANSCKVTVGDLDGDGRTDVVLSQSERAGYPVTWYRSPAPRLDATWSKHPVTVIDFCHTLQAADFDLDGRLDLLVGGMIQSQHRGLRLMLNGGQGKSWTPFVIQTNGSYSAEIGDIDNDGDLDIVGIRNWNSAPSWIYRNAVRSRPPNRRTYHQVSGAAPLADLSDVTVRDRSRGTNLVRLNGNSLCDDTGPFLGLGASYFQALRHAKYDRARLTSNLAFLASKGFNYVRVLSMVNWDGLEIAPVTFTNSAGHRVQAWPDYWQQFRDLLDLVAQHGLRVEVTIFADAQHVMPGHSIRLAHLDGILANIAGRELQLLHLEVANEAWQNGFPGTQGIADLRAFTQYLADRTDVPVAITSNDDTSDQGIISLYRGSAADLATVHFSRDTRIAEGGWLPVRDCYRAGRLPGVPPVSSNEPIGPGSSVSSESDPIKLCSAAVFAYLANLPAYVFHSSAGVYGRERFEDTPGIDAFQFLRQILPGDLASWVRNDGLEPAAPFTVFCNGQPDRYWPDVSGATNGCHRNIGSAKGDQFVCLPMGILGGGVGLQAQRPLRFEVFNPLTGAVVSNLSLSAGNRFTLPQGPGAYILKGSYPEVSPPPSAEPQKPAAATPQAAFEGTAALTHSHTWQRWEHALTSGRSYENPYADVTLRVIYSGPGGRTLRTYGFWDGGDTFRIRCAFPTPGAWQWETECSDTTNTGLHHQRGTVDVSPYRGDSLLYRHGFLKVSDNRRHLVYGNGTPFLWIGDTAWAAFIHANQGEWETYVQNRKAKKYSVIQVHAGAGFTGNNQDRAGQPAFFGEGEQFRWNPGFWQGVGRKVQYANDQGLLVMTCAVGDAVAQLGGLKRNDLDEVRRFAGNLAARLMGDFVAYSPVADDVWSPMADACGTALKEADVQHLVIAHPRFLLEPAMTFHDKDYTDVGGLQSGAGWLYDPYRGEPGKPFSVVSAVRAAIEWPLALYHREPRKPVLNLEGPYDSVGLQTADAVKYGQPYPKRLPRSVGYLGFLSGALGYTGGCGGVWNWGTPVNEATGGWDLQTAINAPSSTEMMYLSEFFARLDWWRLEPAHELIRNQPDDVTRRMVLARSAAGDLAVAYLPNNEAIEIDVSVFPAALAARWFDPVHGRFSALTGSVENKGTRRFTPPAEGDWVLLLQRHE